MIFAPVVVSQREACRQRQVTADDGVAAPEVVLTAGNVHGAALAAAGARALTEHLRHHVLGVYTTADGMAVVTVGGNYMVTIA